MAELSDADILRILELVDQSSFDYFQLTLGDLHLTVSKTGLPPTTAAPQSAGPPPPASAAPAAAAPAVPAPTPTAAPLTPSAPAIAPSAATPAPATGSATAGLVPVPSPMVGTFYVAPAPDAPPFVELGARVEADVTVGLVEAMKVFTSVLAGTPGVIAERLVENAQFVEYGQPLFLVRPESA